MSVRPRIDGKTEPATSCGVHGAGERPCSQADERLSFEASPDRRSVSGGDAIEAVSGSRLLFVRGAGDRSHEGEQAALDRNDAVGDCDPPLARPKARSTRFGCRGSGDGDPHYVGASVEAEYAREIGEQLESEALGR